MSGRDLDSLVALARGAAPAAGDDDDTRVVSAAMLAGAARHRRRLVTRVALSVVALAAAAALGVVVSSARAPRTLTHLELASGDVLTAVPGARFVVEPAEPGVRRLRLDDGAMLFDVKPLAAGERFEVVTQDATVRVVGTVFAVETGDAGTSVHVFEGRVEVRDAAGLHVLRAGESLGAEEFAQLESAGHDAAAARARGAAAQVRVASRDVAPTTRGVGPTSDVAPRADGTEAPAAPNVAPPALAPPDVVPGPNVVPAPHVGQSAERSGPPPALDADDVRGWIAEGRAEDARRAAHLHDGAAWRFTEADALRALRRFAEAADAYDAATRGLRGESQAQAAYLAASLRLTELHDAEGALSSLDAGAVDADDAPLRERGLALRATALVALGRDDDARIVARAYLDSYPRGSRAAFMRAHADAPR